VDLKDTSFFNNTAYLGKNTTNTGRGGAVYYTCSYSLCFFNMSLGNKFQSNWAEISGGSLFFDLKSFNYLDSTTSFLSNSAPYGPDRAAYPVTMRVLENPDSSVYINYVRLQDAKLQSGTKNYDYYLQLAQKQASGRLLQAGDLKTIASGQVIAPPPVFEIVDEYGQTVSTDNSR
jgi:hypothetical protein